MIVPVLDPKSSVAVLESLSYSVGLGVVEVLVAAGGCPARQRNAAVAASDSNLLYFVDDDTWTSPETLKLMVDTLEKLDGVALGGPAVTHPEAPFFERCAGDVMASSFGSGIVRARSTPVGGLRAVEGEELVSCNLLMRKNWFLRVGGLDETLYPGEDVDLMKRLRAVRAPMYYHPMATSRRTRRRTLAGLSYQYYRYGQGRGLRFLKHLRADDMPFLLPTLLLLYLCLSPWVPPHGIYLYLALSLFAGLRIGYRQARLDAGLLCALLFPTQHLSYGFGFLVGLLGIEAKSRCGLRGIERHVLDL